MRARTHISTHTHQHEHIRAHAHTRAHTRGHTRTQRCSAQLARPRDCSRHDELDVTCLWVELHRLQQAVRRVVQHAHAQLRLRLPVPRVRYSGIDGDRAHPVIAGRPAQRRRDHVFVQATTSCSCTRQAHVGTRHAHEVAHRVVVHATVHVRLGERRRQLYGGSEIQQRLLGLCTPHATRARSHSMAQRDATADGRLATHLL
jgi:hypothetical protein